MSFGYFLLFFYCVASNVKGQNYSTPPLDYLIYAQAFIALEIGPEVDSSCVIRHFNEFHDFYILCPSKVSCYVKTYPKNLTAWFTPFSKTNVDGPCESIDGEALPVDKASQLHAVHQMLRLNSETLRDFSSILTLQATRIGLTTLGQLGGSNCYADINEKKKNGERPAHKLRYLNLSFNKIQSLFNDSFRQFKQLEFLAIVFCQLRLIEEDDFVHLAHLTILVLSNNELTHLNDHVFKNNLKLQNLNLMYNWLQIPSLKPLSSTSSIQILLLSANHIQVARDELLFSSTLETLYMDNNDLLTIGSQYSNLPNVTVLLLYAGNITEVDEKAFESLRMLFFLRLDRNRIEDLGNGTFKNNVRLSELDVSENRLKRFPPVGHLYSSVYLHLQGNRISSIDGRDLLNCSPLTGINLSGNRLSSIAEGAFSHARQLKVLNLTHNQLSQKSTNFKSSDKILLLYLNHNNFTSFSFEYFFSGVTQLWLSFNQIETIQDFDCYGQKWRWNLTTLNLSHNRLISIKHFQLPYSVQALKFYSNDISQIISFKDIRKQRLHQLRYVDLRMNNITSLCLSSFHEFEAVVQVNYYISMNPLQCTCGNKWLQYRDFDLASSPMRMTFTANEIMSALACRRSNALRPAPRLRTF